MATTKAPSVEAILDALRRHPDSTAAELAEAAGIGRSTASKALAVLEAEGHATRQQSAPQPGAKHAPDRWTLASQATAGTAEPHGKPAHRPEPNNEPPAAEQSAATPVDGADQPNDTGASRPAGAPPHHGPTIVETGRTDRLSADQPAAGSRLRPGELRSLIHTFLAKRPGQQLTPTRIGKELGRSAGAVGNALATMTDAGEVTQTSAKPRKYMLPAQPSKTTGTQTAAAS
jgi:DNA-binding MarR family transcriptional regulator